MKLVMRSKRVSRHIYMYVILYIVVCRPIRHVVTLFRGAVEHSSADLCIAVGTPVQCRVPL